MTSHTYDAQGRRETTTLPSGRVTGAYVSQTLERALVSLSYPKIVSGSPSTYYGPIGYTVSNLAGKSEASGKIELTGNSSTAAQSAHVDETDADIVTVIDGLGSLCQLSTTAYDESGGTAQKSRLYFLVPASGEGTDGTNYDETLLAYNPMGKRIRTLEPSGTIRRTTYDAMGRVTQSSIGTNDTGLEGSTSSGTSNMVATAASEYDDDAAGGNGFLTRRTLYVVNGTTGQRVTTFDHDVRGSVLLQTNPTAPHSFHEYDNLGRRTESGQFSATTNIVLGTDSPATETSNRLALNETDYDEMGRAWKTTRHKIDAADGSTDDTLTSESWYDAEGRVVNLTDDGERYKYEYDAFYRLRFVKDQSSNTVAEHRYNGLGHRIAEFVDTDDDGDVDANDDERFFAYDERWRIVAHFLNSDTAPTEEFVHHAAGLDGRGRSSYIDLVVLRERDTTANGTLDERMYYCQNWRADVSAIVDDAGEMYEWVKYSAYGVPFGLPGADTDSDGDCDATDILQIRAWIIASAYDVRGDLDLDGDVDSTDKSIAQARLEGVTLDREALSHVGVRAGYAGYERAQEGGAWHVRNRVLLSLFGRWGRRDPLGYIDGVSLVECVASNPVMAQDPSGLRLKFCEPTSKAFQHWLLCRIECLLANSPKYKELYDDLVSSPYVTCFAVHPGYNGGHSSTDCEADGDRSAGGDGQGRATGGSTILINAYGNANEKTHDIHEMQHAKDCNESADKDPAEPQPDEGTPEYEAWEDAAKKAEYDINQEAYDACVGECPDFPPLQ